MKKEHVTLLALVLGSLLLALIFNDTVRGWFGLAKKSAAPPATGPDCQKIASFKSESFGTLSEWDTLGDAIDEAKAGLPYTGQPAFAGGWHYYKGITPGQMSGYPGNCATGNCPPPTLPPAGAGKVKMFRITDQAAFDKLAAERVWHYAVQCVGDVKLV